MARKEDKYRPYRVDYFDASEIQDYDKALIRSVIVRAVTAIQAANMVRYNDPKGTGDGNFVDGRHIIRSYRFYKNIVHKRDVFKAVEDLFTANKAVAVMESIEDYRARTTKAEPVPFDRSSSIFPFEAIVNSTLPQAEKDRLLAGTGPDSPATQAVVADLKGMTEHDTHEQIMDTFVPDPGQPDISKFNLDAAAPVLHPEDLPYTDPNHVCTDKCIDFVPMNDPMPGTPTFLPPQPDYVSLEGNTLPLWLKLALFGGVGSVVLLIVLAVLCHGH